LPLTRLIFHRLLTMLPVWFLISLMSFGLIHLSPGNPAELLLGGTDISQESVNRLSHQMGIDRPLPTQYAIWLTGIGRGDWGYSYFQHQPVLKVLGQHASVTFGIAITGFAFALAIGVPAGIIAPMVPGSPLDAGIALIATLGLSIPEFWLAMLLIIVFAVHLHVVPASGFVPFAASPGGWFWHILLPAFTIGFVQSAAISRIIRSSVLDTLGQAYIQTARGKGLSEGTVLVKHALRSALLPVLTVVGIVLMLLIAGSFVVEIVFAIPGLGLLLLSSMLNHDYPMVQGGILFVGTVIMLTNLLVDITYTLADPRVRYG